MRGEAATRVARPCWSHEPLGGWDALSGDTPSMMTIDRARGPLDFVHVNRGIPIHLSAPRAAGAES